MSEETPAQLDAEIKAAMDRKLISEWGGSKKDRAAVEYGTPLYWALAREDQRKKIAARELKKTKPVNVTGTNLFALAELVAKTGGHVRFPNHLAATDRPHIKRCLDAGYVTIESRDTLALTSVGRTAVADYLIDKLDREQKHEPRDDYYAKRKVETVAMLEKAIETLGSESAR